MRTLNHDIDRDAFFSSLAKRRHNVLMLDFDGTLAPFRLERDRAFPYPGVRERLRQLIDSKSSRVVIISGRWTRDLVPLLGLNKLPEIWGCHGAERLGADGSYSITPLPEPVVAGLVAAEEWARAEGFEQHCERKPISVAFHWRGLPDLEADDIKLRVLTRFTRVARTPSLELKHFDGGLELKFAGVSKARAVKHILDEVPPTVPIAYLGDDLTDEDAFAALDGRGLRVLVRRSLRETTADLWIQPPEELLQFLDDWLAAAPSESHELHD